MEIDKELEKQIEFLKKNKVEFIIEDIEGLSKEEIDQRMISNPIIKEALQDIAQ